MFEFVNFYLIPGIVLGAIYALAAVGISLVFGILRFANFAHGEIMMVGGYLTYSLTQLTGLPPLIAIIPTMVVVAMIAILSDRLFFKPLAQQPYDYSGDGFFWGGIYVSFPCPAWDGAWMRFHSLLVSFKSQ